VSSGVYALMCLMLIRVLNRESFSAVFTQSIYLYYKRRYVCLSVCLYVSMFRMAGQTAGPIETKLDTRTDVHPGSVSGKVNVKVIHVCVRD